MEVAKGKAAPGRDSRRLRRPLAGGWDDAFPGGRASRNRYGDLLPYMGEVIGAQAARCWIGGPDADTVSLTTRVSTPVTPASLTRTITLRAGQARFTLSYELRNTGYLPFDYNWGIHPCLAVQPTWRFDIPATRGLVDEAGGELLGQAGDEYAWPVINGVDLREALGPDRGAFALHYLTGLTAAGSPPPTRRTGADSAFALTPSCSPWSGSVWCMAAGGAITRRLSSRGPDTRAPA